MKGTLEIMTILTKTALSSLLKALPKVHPGDVNLSTYGSSLPSACFSSAYERSHQKHNKVEEATSTCENIGTSTTSLRKTKGGYEGNTSNYKSDENIGNKNDNMSGATGFVARQGTIKATEAANNLADKAKETMDSAWDSVKKTTQNVKDTLVAEADENIIDTTEYRSIEDLANVREQHDHDKV